MYFLGDSQPSLQYFEIQKFFFFYLVFFISILVIYNIVPLISNCKEKMC